MICGPATPSTRGGFFIFFGDRPPNIAIRILVSEILRELTQVAEPERRLDHARQATNSTSEPPESLWPGNAADREMHRKGKTSASQWEPTKSRYWGNTNQKCHFTHSEPPSGWTKTIQEEDIRGGPDLNPCVQKENLQLEKRVRSGSRLKFASYDISMYKIASNFPMVVTSMLHSYKFPEDALDMKQGASVKYLSSRPISSPIWITNLFAAGKDNDSE
ncbi:hypothetical protein C8R44DRAFT_847462 [Mycena epipterygia]|nr:hypothetical protein C8R44DRAFT_847462 [Mycena epipterygia]